MTAAAGSSNSSAMRAAASRSSRFVYDSSLPCCTSTAPKPWRRLECVPAGGLVRVLAVAQDRGGCGSDTPAWSPAAPAVRPDARTDRPRCRSPRASCAIVGVVGRGVGEGAARQVEAEGRARPARRRQVVEHPRRSPPGRRRPGRRAKFLAAARTRLGPPMSISSIRASKRGRRIGGGLGERIQVHDDQVDRLDAVRADGRQVVRPMPPGQDAAVDRRVQRLDPAVEHLREPGDVRDVDHRQAGLGQRLGGPAGRQQRHSLGRAAPARTAPVRSCRTRSAGPAGR